MSKYCRATWCALEQHLGFGAWSDFAGLLHRSAGVEVKPLDPLDGPLRARAEAWYHGDGEWHEAVNIAGVQVSAGAARRFGAGVIRQAALVEPLADDPAATIRVRIDRLAVVDTDRAVELRDDGEELVIAVREDHVSAEAAGQMGVAMARALAADRALRGDGG